MTAACFTLSAVWSFNTTPCFQFTAGIKNLPFFHPSVKQPHRSSGQRAAEDDRTNYSTNFASASSTFPSCIWAQKTLRTFCDLSHRAYLYFSLCTSGTRPGTIRAGISGISKQHLSWGSVEYNGSGRRTSQAIYSAHWFCFSIDCFYFESGCFFPTSVCLFVWSCWSYWQIYCCNLYWVL